jgi:hypothetical protein
VHPFLRALAQVGDVDGILQALVGTPVDEWSDSPIEVLEHPVDAEGVRVPLWETHGRGFLAGCPWKIVLQKTRDN